eukprot:SAG22_NODE_341_length_11992_cov_180.308753_7_plen_127_part_00
MAQGSWFSSVPADAAALSGLVAAVGGRDGPGSASASDQGFGACGGGGGGDGGGADGDWSEGHSPGSVVAFGHGHIDESAMQHGFTKWRSSLALLGGEYSAMAEQFSRMPTDLDEDCLKELHRRAVG